MAKSKAQIEADKAPAQTNLDNDELARIQAEANAKAAADMAAQNEKELAAIKEKAEKEATKVDEAAQKAAKEMMKTPLSQEEIAEMERLELRANAGTYMPSGPEMLKLGKLRQRAKLV